MAPKNNSSYHLVPRESGDFSDDEDINASLFPTSIRNDPKPPPKNRCTTVDLSIILRFLSGVFALAAFILIVTTHGGSRFIPAAVFLMLILVLNIIMILCHYCSSCYLQVSINYQGRQISPGDGSFHNPKVSSYLDLVLSVGLLISLLVVGGIGFWSDRINDAMILGYIVIVFQVIVAVPTLDGLIFNIKAVVKTNHTTPGEYLVHKPDVKRARRSHIAEPESTAIPEAETNTEVAVDLV